jgi:predicted metal-dependent hydrolase
MGRDTDCNCAQSSSHFVRYPLRFPQHDCQGTWPEANGKLASGVWKLCDKFGDIVHCRDMNDEWIGAGSFFHRKNALHGASIERVRAEAIDRLGRKCDQTAGAKALGGPRNRRRIKVGRVDSQNFGHGWVILASMQLALPFGPCDTTAPVALPTPLAPIAPIAPFAPLAPVYFVRHKRARRYVLRVENDGRLRVTIPRGGSRREGEAFVHRHADWVFKQRARARGPRRPIENEQALRQHARDELPRQLLELAARHGLAVTRVSVRNQRSRWGSCGPDGHISLNWRLLLMPPPVREYVLIHELMHLRRLDHSPGYWRLVADAFPDYRAARDWLRLHGPSLR